MDRLYQDRPYPGTVRAIHIRKDLIPDKQRIFLIGSHLFHCLFVISDRRFSRLKNIIHLHVIIKHFHARFLVVR